MQKYLFQKQNTTSVLDLFQLNHNQPLMIIYFILLIFFKSIVIWELFCLVQILINVTNINFKSD